MLQSAGEEAPALGQGREEPSSRSWSHRSDPVPGEETAASRDRGSNPPTSPRLPGCPRPGIFSAKTSRVLDKLGQVGRPGTQRRRQKKFCGFSLPLSSVSSRYLSQGGSSGRSFWETSCRGQSPCHTQRRRPKARKGLEGQQARDWHSCITGEETL